MSRLPTNPEESIQLLVDEGYDVTFVDGALVVRNIPYVAPAGDVRFGTLVVPVALAGDRVMAPRQHAAWWGGEAPCDGLGRPLAHLIASATHRLIGPALRADYNLCNKPRNREFRDYHEYVTTYVALLGTHAAEIDPSATARVNRTTEAASAGSPFRYADTATVRAGTLAATERLASQTVGIIGLGGTGSYVLDLVAKCPVRAIHLFDEDSFQQHNAFRCPGAFGLEDLRTELPKVEQLTRVYSRIHRRVLPHAMRIDEASAAMLDVLDFAFVCVDDGRARKQVLKLLAQRGKRCIDVGMGLSIINDAIVGAVRTTMVSPETHEAALDWIPTDADVADVYASNVQLADLNSLNAALAVIAWKRASGFYAASNHHDHHVFVVESGALHREKLRE